jgi:hypothetical protein
MSLVESGLVETGLRLVETFEVIRATFDLFGIGNINIETGLTNY